MLYEWFENISFANEWVLPFLLMLPVIALIRLRMARTLKAAFRVTTIQTFRVKTAKNAWVNFPFWLQLLALGCIILALARPQLEDVRSKTRGEGIDIVMAMDVSGSMLAPDFKPNRLEVAKEIALDFVRARPVDQIGLVIFSGESYTQYPLSNDHENLMLQIISIKSGMLEDGTLIGEGLATSVQRLEAGKSKSKVVILLTDGKEEAPDTRIIDPITALGIAKAKNVKVYAIGMGAEYATAVSEMNPGVRYSRNTPFIDEDLLRRIARETGGEYFRATNKEGLQLIYDRIDRLEKTEVEVTTQTRYDDQFMYPLLAAIFFIALSLVLKYTLLRTFP